MIAINEIGTKKKNCSTLILGEKFEFSISTLRIGTQTLLFHFVQLTGKFLFKLISSPAKLFFCKFLLQYFRLRKIGPFQIAIGCVFFTADNAHEFFVSHVLA